MLVFWFFLFLNSSLVMLLARGPAAAMLSVTLLPVFPAVSHGGGRSLGRHCLPLRTPPSSDRGISAAGSELACGKHCAGHCSVKAMWFRHLQARLNRRDSRKKHSHIDSLAFHIYFEIASMYRHCHFFLISKENFVTRGTMCHPIIYLRKIRQEFSPICVKRKKI